MRGPYSGLRGALSDRELKHAEAAGKTMLATEPRAAAARYDREAGGTASPIVTGTMFIFVEKPYRGLRSRYIARRSSDQRAQFRPDLP